MKNVFSGFLLMVASLALAPSPSSALTEAEAKSCGRRDIQRIDAAKDGLALLKVYKGSIGQLLAAYDPRDTTLPKAGKELALALIAAAPSCNELDAQRQLAGEKYWKNFGLSEPDKRSELAKYYDWLAVMHPLTYVSDYSEGIDELLTLNGFTAAAKSTQYHHTLVRRIVIEGSAFGNDLRISLKSLGVRPDQVATITADELETLLLTSLKKSEREKFLKWIAN